MIFVLVVIVSYFPDEIVKSFIFENEIKCIKSAAVYTNAKCFKMEKK